MEKVCGVANCNKKQHAYGYCCSHAHKYKRYGDPNHIKIRKVKHGLRSCPEYNVWSLMKKRCNNKNDKNYHRYGGRGIRVCERWANSFMLFYRDMGKRPFQEAQIDRIDNDGNYEPSNCRWVTPVENSRNKGNLTLNIDKAKEIRHKYNYLNFSGKKLMSEYNVSKSALYQVISNEKWKDENYKRIRFAPNHRYKNNA